jgi:MPBQ/MSBQ methyltransferase
MSDAELKAKLKARLLAGIGAQIDSIDNAPGDLAALLQGVAFEAAPVGEAPEGAGAPGGGPDDLARMVNAYYDEAFYSRDGIMGLLLGETEFRNIGLWDETTSNQKEASERLFDALLAFLPEKSGRILDVACGMGASTRRLLRHFPAEAIDAINISQKQVETTRANAPGITAQVMNAVDLRFTDASFDNILCIEAAFHFETRRRFLEEALRVLKPGGRLVLSDVLFTSKERLSQYPTLPSAENHLATAQDYRALLEETGFREIYAQDARDRIWRPHFLHVVNKVHEAFLERRLNLVQLTEILWAYYNLDVLTGPCLLVCARK